MFLLEYHGIENAMIYATIVDSLSRLGENGGINLSDIVVFTLEEIGDSFFRFRLLIFIILSIRNISHL